MQNSEGQNKVHCGLCESSDYKRYKACVELSYLTDNLVPRSPRSFAGLRKWRLRDGPTRRALRRVHWNSLTRENLWSARKLDENYFFLACGDKLAKPPFFVAYFRLRRHYRNLAEGGCRLSWFHFRLCRYFLGHVACRNLPWQGLTTQIWVVTSHQYGISTLVLWRHLSGASRNVSCFLRLSWSPTSGKATREARISDAKVRWLLITVWSHLLTRWERRQTPF